MKKIKAKMIEMLLGFVLKQLSPDQLKEFGDMALDFIENKVQASESKLDDALVLPICNMIRSTFDIPDGDD